MKKSWKHLIIESSEASKEAHDLGLVYAGYGRWKDPNSGLIVAKTVEGKLVRVDSDDTVLPEKRKHSSVQLPKLKKPEEYVAAGDFNALMRDIGDFNAKYAEYAEHYSPPDFYLDPDTDIADRFFREMSEASPKTNDEMYEMLRNVMHVRPDVWVAWCDDPTSMASDLMDTPDVGGFYNPSLNFIGMGIEAAAFIRHIPKFINPQALRKSVAEGVDPNANPHLTYKVWMAARVLHIVIHEMVHAKSRRTIDPSTFKPSGMWDLFLEEALTEMKARQLVENILTLGGQFKLNKDAKKATQFAYQPFVDGLKFLTDRRPDLTQKLWMETDGEERSNLYRKEVWKWIDETLKSRNVGSLAHNRIISYISRKGGLEMLIREPQIRETIIDMVEHMSEQEIIQRLTPKAK